MCEENIAGIRREMSKKITKTEVEAVVDDAMEVIKAEQAQAKDMDGLSAGYFKCLSCDSVSRRDTTDLASSACCTLITHDWHRLATHFLCWCLSTIPCAISLPISACTHPDLRGDAHKAHPRQHECARRRK